MSNHLIEHDAVKWSEQRPIKKTWDSAGTKGGNLLKVTFVDAVTQPRISWKLPVAAQHQLSFLYLNYSPPVDRRAGDQRLGTLTAKFFTHNPP